MDKNTPAISGSAGTLAEDERALMTANQAGRDNAGDARKRLAAALERGKEIYGRVREKTTQGAKAADEALHQHPYQAVGIASGVGMLIGYVVARRWSRDGD